MEWLRLHERIPSGPAAPLMPINGAVVLELPRAFAAPASMETQTHR